MSEPLNNGKILPRNAVAVYTLENGWEYLPDLVAERDSLKQSLEKLQEHALKLELLLLRYRVETPLGNQPHMIAHEVDEALNR